MIQKYIGKCSRRKHPGGSIEALELWYESPLGGYLIQQLGEQLEAFFSTSFGYFALAAGCSGQGVEIMRDCKINHVFRLGEPGEDRDVYMHSTSFPIASDSTDLVILMHALSQSSDPHTILREVDRILIQDGKLVIIDFNPVSLWGVRHLFQSWLDDAPWAGQYYTASRLDDWVSLLGFEQLHHFQCGHMLPFNYQKLIDKSHILSKFMQRWLAFSCALNVLVFEKNTIPLTPTRRQWVKRQILPPKVARPSVGRDMKYERK